MRKLGAGMLTVVVAGALASQAAQAQDRFVFGYSNSGDGNGFDAVRLVTDEGVFLSLARGWFDDTGFHLPYNDNYIAGWYLGREYRNFFSFNLAPLNRPVHHASLRILNPQVVGALCYTGPVCSGYASPNPFERFFVSALDDQYYGSMMTREFGRSDIFAAMIAGPRLGSALISAADDGQFVDVPLDQTALGEINRHVGENWAVAGGVDSIVITPEPSTILLMATGLFVVGVATVIRGRPRIH